MSFLWDDILQCAQCWPAESVLPLKEHRRSAQHGWLGKQFFYSTTIKPLGVCSNMSAFPGWQQVLAWGLKALVATYSAMLL